MSLNNKHNEVGEYDIIIHLGVAVERESNSLETIAYNIVGQSPDAEGQVFSGLTGNEAEFNCPLNLEDLSEKLIEAGFDVKISNSAGDYLCNFIYYQSLQRSSGTKASVLFIHIPPFEKISKETQLKFLDELIPAVIDQHQNRIH